MIEYYEEVSIKGKKSGKCECGKRLTRQTTFSQTINPYNKNSDGRVKSRQEIMNEIVAERELWLKKNVHCNHTGYWQWTSEQREEYNDTGKVEILLECGYPIVKYK